MLHFGIYTNHASFTLPASAISATQTNFICPVQLPASCLTNADGTGLHDVLGSGQTNRKRIDFAINGTRLYAEVKNWASGAFFVKIPTYSHTTNTPLDLFYGGSSQDSTYIGDSGDTAAQNVWENGLSVWNLEQDPTGGAGAIIDSKGSKDGTPYGSMTSGDLVSSQFGNGLDFDGTDDVIDCGSGPLGITGNFTVMFVCKADEEGDGRVFSTMTGSPNYGMMLMKGGNEDFGIDISADGTTYGSSKWGPFNFFTIGGYVVGALVYDGSYLRQYKDGTEQTNGTWPVAWTTGVYDSAGQTILIADSHLYGNKLQGTICHVAVYSDAKSADFISAFSDGIYGTLLTFNGIIEAVRGAQTSINRLSEIIPGVQSIQSILGNLAAVSTIQSIIGNIDDIQSVIAPSGIAGAQTAQNRFSERIEGIRSAMNRLTNDLISGNQTISNQLIAEIRGVQSIINLIAEGITGLLPVRNLISGDGIEGAQTVQTEIDLKDIIRGIQSNQFAMDEPAPEIFAVSEAQNPGEGVTLPDPVIPPGATGISVAVFLDGQNIARKITSLNITINEDSIHNTIEMTSIDLELWAKSNPEINPGSTRIIFQIGSRQMYFLLEERDGDYDTFRIWGRSASAMDSAQYVENITYSAPDKISAQETAEGFLSSLVLDWQVCDWLLPDGFEYEGDPIAGVQTIADIIGAVVRSQDDGNLTVRYRNPVRPYNVSKQSPVATYSTDNQILSIPYKNEKGLDYQGVEVFGDARDLPAPELELIESDPIQGEDCHLKAYFSTDSIHELEIFLTSGLILPIGEYTEKIENVDLTFQEYTASVSRPIMEITDIEWIGNDGGEINFNPYQKELTCEAQYALCKLSYRTKYTKYRVYSHDIEKILTVFSSIGYPDISVKLVIDGVENPILAPAIVDQNLTNQEAATARGKAYLDDKIYDKTVFSIEAAYHEACMDGEIIGIESDREHFAGNVMVKKADIHFDGVKITQSIEAVRWQV